MLSLEGKLAESAQAQETQLGIIQKQANQIQGMAAGETGASLKSLVPKPTLGFRAKFRV